MRSALLVMNKIDMLDDFEPRIDRDDENKPIRVWLSAQTGVGVPLLFQALTERLSGEVAQHTLRLPPKEGRLRSRFYQLQAIEKEWMEDDGSVSLQVRMPIVDWRRLCKQSQRLLTMWFDLAACLKILTPVGYQKQIWSIYMAWNQPGNNGQDRDPWGAANWRQL